MFVCAPAKVPCNQTRCNKWTKERKNKVLKR